MHLLLVPLGFLLIAVGIGLFWWRPPDWRADGRWRDQTRQSIERWMSRQRVVRRVTNGIVILIGAAIIGTTWLPQGTIVWGGLWSAILGLVCCALLLAAVDSYCSLAGYRQAVPEAAHRAFSPEEQSAADEDAGQENGSQSA
ncbi:MAG: hypothetical protein KatS3mg111_1437 [Pirellulaceae bacterium]|nr:MAG: hypothetical protein KatS3mg111_1437 [Pirellulaceae bacterium]